MESGWPYREEPDGFLTKAFILTKVFIVFRDEGLYVLDETRRFKLEAENTRNRELTLSASFLSLNNFIL